jgi:diguanylate cyclase (GGDEF)-like protein
MSDSPPVPVARTGPRRAAVPTFVGSVALVTVVVAAAVARVESTIDHSQVNWWAFAVFGALLVVAEARPSFSLRFGEGGEITPGWAFAFALLLLGSPLSAMALSALATLIADLVARKSPIKVVFNVSQVSLSLGLGALVLHMSGLSGPSLTRGDISFLQSLGMILSGFVVLFTSAMLLFVVMALSRGISVWVPIKEGWLTSVSADGALLAIAPIFVVAVDYSLLLLPMLGVTSFIVFTSARQAMRQAHAASHDTLTSLRNRAAFRQILEQRLVETNGPDVGGDGAPVGPQQRSTLLLIDLDGFKEVNDRLGHATGDALLVAFADHMERCIPSTAVAARLGGDEFAILLPAGENQADDLRTVRDLRLQLAQTLSVDGFPIAVGMSIGVACAPEHATNFEELMSCADVAMYRAKRFRTGVEMYGSVGAAKEHGRIGLLGALSSAIENDELTLAYQPQVRMATGECEVVEALLRWQHPSLGAIPPGDFVSAAEHTELIAPLSQFVLERAVADLVALDTPDLAVAINVSARNLQDRHFPGMVLATLQANRLEPHRLELEITEGAIASEPERSRVAIETLRDAGVRITIDDFGTGYSSFLSLRDLEVDRLKIDRSFIARLGTATKDVILVRSIIELASQLGLDTVAEGIEDMETWNLVTSLGCDVGQGFLVARPLAFREMAAWLQRRRLFADLSEFERRTLVG